MINNKLKTLISEAFPGLTIHSLAQIGSGKAGEIFLANNEIVFKVPLVSDNSSSCLSVEYNVLAALYGKVRAAIPQPLYFGTLSDGRLILGESLVPGIQFTQALYESLSQREKDIVFEKLGEFFCQIHSADVPKIEGIPTNGVKQSLNYFHEYYQDIVKKELTSTEQVRIDEIVYAFCTVAETTDIPIVLCHGDAHFWNFNFDPETKQICGFLDFGIANYADPLSDMRYYWSLETAKILKKYPGNIGKNAGIRHLFYCICNLIEEAYYERTDGGSFDYINSLKQAIYQESLDYMISIVK